MEKDKDIKTAGEKLKYLSKDEEIRRIAELKEKARRDAVAVEQFNIQRGLEKGLKQGIEQGIEQGMEKSKMVIAKNMLNEKIDINIISKVTGLSEKEINKMK